MYYFKWMICFFLFFYSAIAFANLRDPTQPIDFTFVPNQQGAFALSSIIISEQRKIAVINETILQVGDEILGNKVVEIEPNTVQLEGGSGRITLFLLGAPIKQEVDQTK